MRFITKLILPLFVAVPVLVSAQSEVASLNGLKWSLVPLWPNPSVFRVSACNSSGSSCTEGAATGILKIDDNSVVSNVQLDASDYGVIRLNKDLSTKWLTKVDGYPLSIGLFAGQVLVIAANEYSITKGPGSIYTGYLIDPASGNITLKKNMYTGADKLMEQPVFMYAPDGSFFKMAVRTSNFTRALHSPLLAFKRNSVMDDYFTTTDFKLFEFANNLEVKSTIKPVLEQGYFLGGTTNKNGDVFLLSDFSQGYIKIARYENGKTTPARVLKIPVSMDDDVVTSLYNTYLFTSKKDPMVLFFAMTYPNVERDRELVVSKLNFKDGTATRNNQVMDKDYLKGLAKSYVPFSKKFDDVNLGNKGDLKIRNIVENDGKIIVALSSHTVQSSYNPNDKSSRSNAEAFDVLVNIYNEKADLQYQQIIPRRYNSINDLWIGVGLHCKDNMLYLTANNDKGWLGYKAIFAQIDLKNGSIVNITGVDKKEIKGKYAANPLASFWFDKQFVLSYMENKGILFSRSEDAHLQLLNY